MTTSPPDQTKCTTSYYDDGLWECTAEEPALCPFVDRYADLYFCTHCKSPLFAVRNEQT